MEEDYGYEPTKAAMLNFMMMMMILQKGLKNLLMRLPIANICLVISKESLLASQKDDLERVMDLLSLMEHHVRTLLIHNCWNVDKIFMEFIEKGKERLYAEAGVSVSDSSNLGSCHFSSEITCEICYEDFPAKETTTMDCGHCFCNECWTEHFIVKINE